MRRSVALTVLIIVLLIPTVALANHAEDLTLDCDGWSVQFLEFNHTDHELLITVNGIQVYFATNPPDGDFPLSGPLPEGIDGLVTLATFWRHLQGQVEGPSLTVELDCTPEVTTTTITTTTTTQTVETTTTTAAPCAPGLIHEPPLCVDPTTSTIAAPTTTTAPPATTTDTLPFTGVNDVVYKVAALGASLSMLFGLVILMFVKREMD